MDEPDGHRSILSIALDPIFLVSGLAYVILSSVSRKPGSSLFLKVSRFVVPVVVALLMQRRRLANRGSLTGCPAGTICPYTRRIHHEYEIEPIAEVNLTAELGEGYSAEDLLRFQNDVARRFLCARKPVVVRGFQDIGAFAGLPSAAELSARHVDTLTNVDVLNYSHLLEHGPSAEAIERDQVPLHTLLRQLGESPVSSEAPLSTAWYARWGSGHGARNVNPSWFSSLTSGHKKSVDLLSGATRQGVCALEDGEPVVMEDVSTKLRIGSPGYSKCVQRERPASQVGMGRWATVFDPDECIKNAGYPMHMDLAHNLAQQLAGEKHVTLFSPRDIAHVYPPDEALFHEMVGFPFWSAVIDPYRRDAKRRFPLLQRATAYTSILRAGDVLFVPMLWQHYFHSASGMSVMANTFLSPKHSFDAYLIESLPEEWLRYREDHSGIIPHVSRILFERGL